jgi:hypothetical protein
MRLFNVDDCDSAVSEPSGWIRNHVPAPFRRMISSETSDNFSESCCAPDERFRSGVRRRSRDCQPHPIGKPTIVRLDAYPKRSASFQDDVDAIGPGMDISASQNGAGRKDERCRGRRDDLFHRAGRVQSGRADGR